MAKKEITYSKPIQVIYGEQKKDRLVTEQELSHLAVPVGTVISYPSLKVPAGYLICDGREVGRDIYPQLFEVLGTDYGEGDGETTFQLPDFRGLFLRGLDLQKGLDLDRQLGEQQGDAIRNITGALTVPYGREYPYQPEDPENAVYRDGFISYPDGAGATCNHCIMKLDISRNVPTAEENRPVNMAVVYCIKAFGAPVEEGSVDLAALVEKLDRLTQEARSKLKADTTFYVRKEGSDNNDGLTAETAFATIQQATAHLTKVDGCGYSVTVDIGPGTWTGRSFELGQYLSSGVLSFTGLVGISQLFVRGAGTETIIDGEQAQNGFVAGRTEVIYHLENLAFTNCLAAVYTYCKTNLAGKIRLGTCSSCQINVEGGSLWMQGEIEVTGNAYIFTHVANNGFAHFADGSAVTFVGNPSLLQIFHCTNSSILGLSGTFSGNATGQKYEAVNLSLINGVGKKDEHLPGTIAGGTVNGGLFV